MEYILGLMEENISGLSLMINEQGTESTLGLMAESTKEIGTKTSSMG